MIQKNHKEILVLDSTGAVITAAPVFVLAKRAENRNLRAPQHHFPALLLSLAVHAGAGVAIGTVFQAGEDWGQPTSPQVLTVHLERRDLEPVLAYEKALQTKPVLRQRHHVALEPASSSDIQPAQQGAMVLEPPTKENALPTESQDAPRYFKLSELTEKPVVVQDVPEDLLRGIPGGGVEPLILRLFINELGSVDRVAVENSRLPEQVERHMVDAFLATRFKPGYVGRLPVKSQLRIEVLFLKTIQATGSH